MRTYIHSYIHTWDTCILAHLGYLGTCLFWIHGYFDTCILEILGYLQTCILEILANSLTGILACLVCFCLPWSFILKIANNAVLGNILIPFVKKLFCYILIVCPTTQLAFCTMPNMHLGIIHYQYLVNRRLGYIRLEKMPILPSQCHLCGMRMPFMQAMPIVQITQCHLCTQCQLCAQCHLCKAQNTKCVSGAQLALLHIWHCECHCVMLFYAY